LTNQKEIIGGGAGLSVRALPAQRDGKGTAEKKVIYVGIAGGPLNAVEDCTGGG